MVLKIKRTSLNGTYFKAISFEQFVFLKDAKFRETKTRLCVVFHLEEGKVAEDDDGMPFSICIKEPPRTPSSMTYLTPISVFMRRYWYKTGKFCISISSFTSKPTKRFKYVYKKQFKSYHIEVI